MGLMWGKIVSQKNESAMTFFDSLVSKVRPTGILEMGTGFGGFTLYLWVWARLLENGCKVMSVDKVSRPSLQRFAGQVYGLEFVVGNFYAPDVVTRMCDFLDSCTATPRLFLCDGAVKNEGVMVDTKMGQVKFSMERALVGDFVLSHDFNAPAYGGVTEEELAAVEKAHGFERCWIELSTPAQWSCSVKVRE